jgi:hypothetical protein
LPHANAAVAPGLMQARPRTYQFRQQPQLREVFQDLAGGGRQSLAMLEVEEISKPKDSNKSRQGNREDQVCTGTSRWQADILSHAVPKRPKAGIRLQESIGHAISSRP